LNPGGGTTEADNGRWVNAVLPHSPLTLATVIEYVSRMTCEWHWWHSWWAWTKHGDNRHTDLLENVDCSLRVRQQTAMN